MYLVIGRDTDEPYMRVFKSKDALEKAFDDEWGEGFKVLTADDVRTLPLSLRLPVRSLIIMSGKFCTVEPVERVTSWEVVDG
jgi:hypothetical protein